MLRSYLFLFALVSLSPSAIALQTFCVSNMGQYDAAWQASDSDDVEIRMVVGNYSVAGSCIELFNNAACQVSGHDVLIRGGYNAGCGSRVSDPGATWLIGSDFPLRIEQSSVTLDQVRLSATGPVRFFLGSGDYLELNRVWVSGLQEYAFSADYVVMRNSLMTSSGVSGGVFSDFSADSFLIENNTFVKNQIPPVFFQASGTIRNNIFWDNGSADISFQRRVNSDEPHEFSTRNNLWGNASGLSNLANAPMGTLSGDPRFVNSATADYRLQAISPAINTAFTAASFLTQLDFAGGQRWFGDAPDRGAFESSIGTTAPLITVQNTNDSGIGSLRQAILDANALPNVNRIEFNIGSTCGPRNIVLNSPLPAITQSVVIDGYTQPGAVRNTLANGSNAVRCIAITGGGTVINGVSTSSNDSAAITLDGLGFGGFSLIAVNLTGGNGHRFIGSQIGGVMGPSASELTLAPSVNGVQVGSLLGTSAADGVEIGGNTPAERNVFSDITDAAIRIGNGAEDARVFNNYIGIGTSGSSSTEANRDGVVINGLNNQVHNNVISNNTRHGVLLTGANARANSIIGNRIGLQALCTISCSSTLGNVADGVRIENSANDNIVERNVIRYNGDDGVVIANAVRNAIIRNDITNNTEQPIDLGADGTSNNGNNTTPPAGAANFGQNRPALLLATGNAGFGFASGTLTSANGTYRIDAYAAINCALPPFLPPVASGEPETWLGNAFMTISNGTASLDGNSSFAVLIGTGSSSFFNSPRRIVVSATRMSGSSSESRPRSTSELTSCVSYETLLFQNGFE